MDRFFVIAGAALGLLGVGLGAFGAHALKAHFQGHPTMQPIYKTATDYQIYHALALLGAAWAGTRWPSSLIPWSGYSFIFGTVVFSGSLYVLSITTVKGWGAITPIGGVALLAGWLCLAIGVWRGARSRNL